MILDALRKADAERERGSVPGLNAQPVPLASGEVRTPARARPWLLGALGIAAGLVVAFAAVVALRGGPGTPERAEVTARSNAAARTAAEPASSLRSEKKRGVV